ncbi:RnfABCDGE type electron transport complex subunit D [Fusibacter sp. JL216-2]|uniref:RnfABCDGE type electron transport complex subunit D n=1 Tax=Fusibacter sp. JL216-2 TaxID=3071453 RepID=UPI003D340A22
MEQRLIVSSSPHIRSKESVNSIMRDVVLALTPATVWGIYKFGVNAFMVVAVAILAAMATEAAIQKLRGVPVTVNDWSAVLTGLLLAMNVPASAPWWIPVIGSIFAIAVVKQAFGGLGHNFMNPALAARAMLMASWPVRMTAWTTPNLPAVGADAVSTATPLAMLKDSYGFDVSAAVGSTTMQAPSMMDVLLGNVAGCIGEVSAVLLILGGLYLMYKKVITWRIPTIYIGTVAVLTFILGGFDPTLVLYHVFAGGLMLGAFFMATDYASSPINPKGQMFFAFGCGLLTTVIRFYGGYPEGVSYSILLMNVAAPLIEKYSSPRVFGGGK